MNWNEISSDNCSFEKRVPIKVEKGCFSSTSVDSHGERMSLDALKIMCERMNEQEKFMSLEHDSSKPPIGKLKEAKIEEIEKDIFGITGEVELFEEIPEEVRAFSVAFTEGEKNE